MSSPRVTSDEVKGILLRDYNFNRTPDVTPFITGANLVVDRVQACALQKGITLTSPELKEIERWLSAHFYCQSDKAAASQNTSQAGGTYQGRTDMGFDSTYYGQTAMRIDYSGCLAVIDKRKTANLIWLGKNPSSWIPAEGMQ